MRMTRFALVLSTNEPFRGHRVSVIRAAVVPSLPYGTEFTLSIRLPITFRWVKQSRYQHINSLITSM